MPGDMMIPPSVWYAEVPRSTRLHIGLGIGTIGLIMLGFGSWAATAPLAGAIVSSGVFVAAGQNKVVQHLEGGVIKDLWAREGEFVREGQTLAILDDTVPKAEVRRLELRVLRLEAAEARLQCEASECREPTYPPALLTAVNDPELATITDNQQMRFRAQKRSQDSDIAALNQSVASLEQHNRGAQEQLKAVRAQLGYVQEELSIKETLLKGGMTRKSEVLALRRSQASLIGEAGRLDADLGDTDERIARTREQINGLRQTAMKMAVDQLQDVRADLYDSRERLRAARNALARIRITAPVTGTVIQVNYHTAGGVIEPGKILMQILPANAELIIETRIRPQDIDHVKPDLEATVRLNAMNQRVTPMVVGRVIYVSADAINAQNGTSSEIYLARIQLGADSLTGLQNVRILPGMPVEVYIKTADRTFLDYLLKPIKDSMTRAFRES